MRDPPSSEEDKLIVFEDLGDKEQNLILSNLKFFAALSLCNENINEDVLSYLFEDVEILRDLALDGKINDDMQYQFLNTYINNNRSKFKSQLVYSNLIERLYEENTEFFSRSLESLDPKMIEFVKGLYEILRQRMREVTDEVTDMKDISKQNTHTLKLIGWMFKHDLFVKCEIDTQWIFDVFNYSITISLLTLVVNQKLREQVSDNIKGKEYEINENFSTELVSESVLFNLHQCYKNIYLKQLDR